MPSVSERQRRAMYAASEGHSNLGIPKSVGEEFVRSDATSAPDAGDLTDFEAAEAVRDGELPSPQKYGDFWLFDLRVTGTGAAYRDSIDEWAVRDPRTWLSDEFVQRCNGLPVVFGHPERSGIDNDYWRDNSLGAIMLPYVKGDEVWGIARIYDADAAALMQTTHCSTSPGVVPPKGSISASLKDGTKVLAEDLPLVLDHLAICEAGVWDKDGPPDGVRLDARKDLTVTDEERKALEKERDDARKDAADAKTKLDEFEKADSARKDAEAEKEREDKKRHDAEESEEKDDAKKDADETEEEKKALEAADKDKKDARKDGAKEETVEADRGTDVIKDSKDSTARDLIANQAKTIERLQSQMADMRRTPSHEDADALSKAFHRADSIYQMHGERTPQPYPGETPIAYRRRLANGLKPFAGERWQNYALHDSIDPTAFDLIEERIYDQALQSAKDSGGAAVGTLREVVSNVGGKQTVRFYGDAREAFAPFMPPVQRFVRSINRTPGVAR